MLVGRETERRMIERLVAGARVGSSGVLLITGEPGIGKTALVDDAVRHADGMRVLRARGTEAEREVPFGGLLQLLRPALDLLDRIPGPQRDALAAALALRPGPPGDRFAVGAATLSMLSRYAETGPLVLVLDDVHLFDRPSAEAVLFAARRLLADPIALLAAARTGESHPLADADLPELHLTGVDLPSARRLLAPSVASSVHGSGIGEDVVAWLHRTVGGNPLALIDLAGDLDRLGAVPPDAPAPVPAVLAETYSARTAVLGDDVRSALLVAAAEGGDLAVIARACKTLGVDVAALAGAERAGLVSVEGARVEFRHPLVRSAVYAGADPVWRRTVHSALAEASADPDRRAWHLSEAVLGTDPVAAAALAETAVRAADRGAYAVAATAYERSARLSPDVDAVPVRLVAAGEAAWYAGLPDRARRLLAEALALDPPVVVQTRADAVRGDIAVKCGSPKQAVEILATAARRIADEDADDAVDLFADAVYASFFLGDTALAVGMGAELDLLLPRTRRPGTRAAGLMARGVTGVMTGSGGTDRLRRAVRLLAAGDVSNDRRLVLWAVMGPLFLRESGTGRSLIEDALKASRDRGSIGVLPSLLFLLARDQATTQRWTDAATAYDEAIRLARETGQTTELGISLAGLAWLHAQAGREDECRSAAAEAIWVCTGRKLHLGHGWALFALGDLELGGGAPGDAVQHFERLAGVLETGGILDTDLSPAPELVEAYMRLGRTDEAARLAAEYADRAGAKGQPWALARAHRALGLTGPDERLDEHFGAALEAHDRTLDVFQTARTRFGYGARLRRARRRVEARGQLREAVTQFDQLGAAAWAELAAAELKATGETARRREPSTVTDLTPQERQIALLLADGLSTREAAAAMFLSPKTIEYHLRNVYAKLGIHSRAELTTTLQR